MDFSGATTLMTTFKTFCMYAGAVICLICLIWAALKMMGGRFTEAVPHVDPERHGHWMATRRVPQYARRYCTGT